MKYRGREQIISDILKVVEEADSPNKTKIMYKAYLSYSQLKEYLEFLTKKEIISEDKHGCFHLMQKGADLLMTLDKARTILS